MGCVYGIAVNRLLEPVVESPGVLRWIQGGHVGVIVRGERRREDDKAQLPTLLGLLPLVDKSLIELKHVAGFTSNKSGQKSGSSAAGPSSAHAKQSSDWLRITRALHLRRPHLSLQTTIRTHTTS